MFGQMRNLYWRFFFCVWLGVISVAAHAQSDLTVRLIAENDQPRAGETVMLALEVTPNPGWHGYWKNPGEAGRPPEFAWIAPEGVEVGVARFPVPQKLIAFNVMNHVYEAPHAFLIPVTISAGLAKGTVLPLRLQADLLACSDKLCRPQRIAQALVLRVGSGGGATKQALFDKWRRQLSRPLGSVGHFEKTGGKIRVEIPVPASVSIETPWLFSAKQYAFKDSANQTIWRDGNKIFVEADAGDEPPETAFKGLLAIGKDAGLEFEAVPGRVVPTGKKLAQGASEFGFGLLILALGGASLGGLLLNIMPCVFPIISLKALSLARIGGDDRAARSESLAYTAGVILTCLLLGAIILALRAFGVAVGWSFQLQHPAMIFFLFALAAAMTASLAGLIHLRGFSGDDALAGQGGRKGAFWTGALAAFVATPCTGPFMAAALGAALVLPPLAALLIFGGLGLGLAAPFLLIGFIPQLRGWIPRPGPWMVRFQKLLAIPMGLTMLALLWLIWRQTGVLGLSLALAFALGGAAFLLRRHRQNGVLLGGLSLLVGCAAFAGLGAILPKSAANSGAPGLAGKPFTVEALAAAQRAGKPVFAYFTADWCLTCKVNEKAAIETEAVQSAFIAKGVVVLVGDWTNGDPAITRFLESQRRNGVPLYLAYKPGVAHPQELPQLLTPETLVNAF